MSLKDKKTNVSSNEQTQLEQKFFLLPNKIRFKFFKEKLSNYKQLTSKMLQNYLLRSLVDFSKRQMRFIKHWVNAVIDFRWFITSHIEMDGFIALHVIFSTL